MAYQEIGDFNLTEGLGRILVYTSTVVPIFIPLLLFSIFISFTVGFFYSQKSVTGDGKILSAMATASLITTIIAYIMSLIEGVISNLVLIPCIAITIIFLVLLFVTKED